LRKVVPAKKSWRRQSGKTHTLDNHNAVAAGPPAGDHNASDTIAGSQAAGEQHPPERVCEQSRAGKQCQEDGERPEIVPHQIMRRRPVTVARDAADIQNNEGDAKSGSEQNEERRKIH
jgi:hypothetical protein